MVHARLDDEAHAMLEEIRRRTGLSESEILRTGLEAVAERLLRPGRQRVVGVGKFDSGVRDLGSNERHLKGFGST